MFGIWQRNEIIRRCALLMMIVPYWESCTLPIPKASTSLLRYSHCYVNHCLRSQLMSSGVCRRMRVIKHYAASRSEEHTSELQSRFDLVCRLLLEKKTDNIY